MSKVAQVAVLAKVGQLFTYALPEGLASQAMPGTAVVVPLGRQRVTGIIWQISEAQATPYKGGLKSIERLLEPRPALSETLLEWLKWGSEYYLTKLGEVLRAGLPPFLTRPHRGLARGPQEPMPEYKSFHKLAAEQLTSEQRRALDKMLSGPRSFLLHGITGSGKTEVYSSLIEKVLAQGNGVIILVPEIGLTPQLAGEFRARFRDKLAIYHSGLGAAHRSAEWRRAAAGEARVVLGTRSALFLPVRNLGLIIIDEEHDSSYKQSTGFHYHARRMAMERARREGAMLLLGSATPSIESIYLTSIGELEILTLSERPTGQPLPSLEIVDMRRRGGRTRGAAWLSEELRQAIGQATEQHQQVLLFLNRKGFASLLCPQCGHIPQCPQCSVSLTLHQRPSKLLCHYCDLQLDPTPPKCPSCHDGHLIPIGAGTERIESEVKKAFPKLKVARLDRSVAARKGYVEDVLTRMKKREIDILVGTQMVAKGHDYPGITLVGVIDADTALAFPDFRAAERSYQLLVQVAGRAGRGLHLGRVVVQSYHPDHPALRAALFHDPDAFFAKELGERRRLFYPPFSTLILLRVAGKNPDKVVQSARRLHQVLVNDLKEVAHILGPAPAPLVKLRGKTRWQILLKIPDREKGVLPLARLLDRLPRDGILSGVDLEIDVDPLDML